MCNSTTMHHRQDREWQSKPGMAKRWSFFILFIIYFLFLFYRKVHSFFCSRVAIVRIMAHGRNSPGEVRKITAANDANTTLTILLVGLEPKWPYHFHRSFVCNFA